MRRIRVLTAGRIELFPDWFSGFSQYLETGSVRGEESHSASKAPWQEEPAPEVQEKQ
jgi:hypothetical protein